MNKVLQIAKKPMTAMSLLVVAAAGVLHLWNLPLYDADKYLLMFAAIYVVLAIFFVVLIVLQKGWFKLIPILGFLLSACVAGYDLFGAALISSVAF